MKFISISMKNILLLAFATVLFSACERQSTAQTHQKGEYLVMFYNVENLFDTIDSPDTHDEEFTPEGRKSWTRDRYEKKINDIAKVIDAVGGEAAADIIGLCEVENRRVLDDLVNHDLLKEYSYSVIHHDSPDERGIDVALLFRKSVATKLYVDNIQVDFAWDKDDNTRDILYAKLKLNEGPLHLFVNHWSSRGGGVEYSSPKRIRSAALVREYVDSIQNTEPDADIIVMGDLNDEPHNISVERVLFASGREDYCEDALFNLADSPVFEGKGTYHYWRENKWNMLDQIIISRSLLDEYGLKVTENHQGIFKPEWILYENEDGSKVPSKTFGKGYYGGYSDHLPVYIYLSR